MVQQATKTRKSKVQKTVTIIARYFVKRNGAVVYLVRSSNGIDTYRTTIIRGKATGCDCPARKPCYHMVQLEQIERERAKRLAVTHQMKAVVTVEAAMQEAQTTIEQHIDQVAAQAEQQAEKKMVAHLQNDTYELTAAQKRAALDEERNHYNAVALALGW